MLEIARETSVSAACARRHGTQARRSATRLAELRRGAGCEVVQDLAREGLEIFGLAAGDEVAIVDDLLVNDDRAAIAEIALDRLPGGQRAPVADPGGDHDLRAVTDRGDELPLAIELLDEVDEAFVGAQLIGR